MGTLDGKIAIGSALGSVAAPDVSPHVASKGGLNSLARAAAVELVQDEIRRHLLNHRIPIGRAGHVDDIASACRYLASDAARYVTGSILAVDGGWTAS
jgi:NAD(P)-dependent dehydrogenase (short-subunit alcohol dehydrogenase family)